MYRALQLEGTPVRTGVPSQTAEIEIKVGNTVNDGWHASCVRYAIRPDNGITKQFKRLCVPWCFFVVFLGCFLAVFCPGKADNWRAGPRERLCVPWCFLLCFLVVFLQFSVDRGRDKCLRFFFFAE